MLRRSTPPDMVMVLPPSPVVVVLVVSRYDSYDVWSMSVLVRASVES